MYGENQIIGEIIDRLIYIKDNYGIEDREDIDAINNACNILAHRFNRFDTTDTLINNHVTSVHWQHEDIKVALVEKGFSPNEDNVNIVVSYPGFKKYLQEHGIEAGWSIIYNTISELKNTLDKSKER